MTEYEIYELIRLYEQTIWSNLQWWASISFGLIAMGHFLGKRLGLGLAIFASAIYSVVSAYMLFWVFTYAGHIGSFLAELMAREAEGTLSAVGMDFLTIQIAHLQITTPLFWVCALPLFIGTIGYVVICYRRARGTHRQAMR